MSFLMCIKRVRNFSKRKKLNLVVVIKLSVKYVSTIYKEAQIADYKRFNRNPKGNFYKNSSLRIPNEYILVSISILSFVAQFLWCLISLLCS